MNKSETEIYISSIKPETVARYSAYWKTITPATDRDIFNRWAFAFLSVHTTWTSNVRAYNALSLGGELTEKQKLLNIIVGSRVGLNTMRTDGIWKFYNDFKANPGLWNKLDNESWTAFRARTMNLCHGLGYAKTSFAIELCHPEACEVTCLDTHMLRMYGEKSSPAPSKAVYLSLEDHWVSCCRNMHYSPFMVRNLYWDAIQKQMDTRYWSSVFEEKVSSEK